MNKVAGPRDRPCRGGNSDESNAGGNADQSDAIGDTGAATAEKPARNGIVITLPLMVALAASATRRRARLRGDDPDL